MTAVHISGELRQSYVPVLKYCDELNDVAVLKIEGKSLDFFGLPVHSPEIGERVFAIGNPRGLEQSISEGIVSGNRVMDGTSWIQHSAPISPGSSGGALISARGELVGINSRLLEESQNLNFAVPASTLATALKRARVVTGDLKFPQDGDAEFSRALLYYRGQGVTQDYSEAARLLRQAADKGHAEAQASLGAAYQLGRGVTQDYAQAAAWYKKAAEQGFPFAQNALGTLLSEGNGVPKDDAEAAKWFRRAAEQGDTSAQFNLGAAYQLGTGVSMDYSESYFWYRVASAGQAIAVTPEQLRKLQDIIATHLTPEALSRAQERAREWISSHPAN